MHVNKWGCDKHTGQNDENISKRLICKQSKNTHDGMETMYRMSFLYDSSVKLQKLPLSGNVISGCPWLSLPPEKTQTKEGFILIIHTQNIKLKLK